MEDFPVCRKDLCKICHGDLEEQLTGGKDSPNYTKLTRAVVLRAIETRLKYPRPPTPSKKLDHITTPRLKFEDLPTEIRLQIYRDCLFQRANGSGYFIDGWVKGGFKHRRGNERRTSSNCDGHGSPRWPTMHGGFEADSRFHTQVFCLNKRIYAEAREEVYRNINIRMRSPYTNAVDGMLKYWFGEHSMRFITRLEVPFYITSMAWRLNRPHQDARMLTQQKLRGFARISAQIPNLNRLDVMLLVQYTSVPYFQSKITKLARFRDTVLATAGKRGQLGSSAFAFNVMVSMVVPCGREGQSELTKMLLDKGFKVSFGPEYPLLLHVSAMAWIF